MAKYPDPIILPDTVQEERVQRRHELIGSSLRGILIRLSIICFELAGVWIFSSSSLLLDSIASFIDVISSVLLLLCIRLAAKPPDENHPFGHGRYEPLVGLQLGGMLIIFGIGMMIQQLFQLAYEPSNMIMSSWAWIFPLIALILLEICYRIVMRAARRQNSPALEADALHYRVDGITSLFATIALALAAFFPDWSITFDHIGAILIAILMIFLGIYAAKKNLNQLMDRVPDEHFFDLVRHAAKKVEGVRDTEKIRIQLYGPDAHVDIDIEVDPKLTVEYAHSISQKVRAEIQKAWPSVRDVMVHIEPFYPDDH